MLDLVSMVKDILEINYSISEEIESAVESMTEAAVDRWMRTHDFSGMVRDAVEMHLDENEIHDAVVEAIEDFVSDAI